MTNFNCPPESISHKQLHALLSQAPKEAYAPNKEENLLAEEEKFKELLTHWQAISKELLLTLKPKADSYLKGRSSKSIMALGALEAHLTMAIQAKIASDIN